MPFLVAFGVIGLVMSVLIVANVVSGAVVSGYRRIGILKSIGFTPGQVVAAYAGQVVGAGRWSAASAAWCSGTCWPCRCWPRPRSVYGVGTLGVPAVGGRGRARR